MKYKYTKEEQQELLNSLVVLVDTREKVNGHILDFFDDKKIKYVKKKLDFGDYSFYIPQNDDLNIKRDVYFNDEIVVERKNSLDELATNFTKNRTQFENELTRKNNSKFYLMIENADYKKLENGIYRSKYTSKSFLATLFTYEARYNISIDFVYKEFAAKFIFLLFYYYAREIILNKNIRRK